MSKKLKTIVGVVASIAIPFAAPALVASIAGSGFLGTAMSAGLQTSLGATLGSAATGAGMGALSSGLLGGDVAKGALYGGIGGGIGGYLKGPAGAVDAAGGAAQGGTAAGTAPQVAGVGVGQGTTWTGAGAGGVANTANQGGGFLAALRSMPAAVAKQFSDPKTLARLTLKAGGQLAGAAIAGSGMSGAEEKLLDAQRRELETLQQTNKAEYDMKMEQARKLLGEAESYDPEYMGLQSARRAQTQAGLATTEATRGMTGEQLVSERRKRQLGAGRNVGTAYDTGFSSGVENRTRARQAGLAAIPSMQTTSGAYSALANAYGDADTRAQAERTSIGGFLGSLYGEDKATSTGDEEEKKNTGANA